MWTVINYVFYNNVTNELQFTLHNYVQLALVEHQIIGFTKLRSKPKNNNTYAIDVQPDFGNHVFRSYKHV